MSLLHITHELRNRLRREEYVGEDRCWACTVVNVVIVGVIAVVLVPLSGPAALVVFIGGLAPVYFRGYLVPRTPTLTKQYLPTRVLAMFGKQPLSVPRTENADTWLLSQGLIRKTSDGDLTLDSAFESSVCSVEPPVSPPESLARDILELPPTAGSFTEQRGRYTLSQDGDPVAAWPSELALVADFQGKTALSKRYTGWAEYSPAKIAAVLRSLRATADKCPQCDAPTEYDRTTHETCCASVTVERLACPRCDEALVELRR